MRKNLGGITDSFSEIDALKKELEASNAQVMELKLKLARYETEMENE